MSQLKTAAVSASDPNPGAPPIASMNIPWRLIEATLAHLSDDADEQEMRWANVLGAAGLREAVRFIRGHLQSLGDWKLTPEEAHDYSGYSVRHLRRLVENCGTERKPVYRLGDLPIVPGHTPRLPKDLGRQRTIADVDESAAGHRTMSEWQETEPVVSSAAAPHRPGSGRGSRSETSRGSRSEIEARALALARASSRKTSGPAAAA